MELAERQVEVYRFEEVWRDGPSRGFVIECSAGTYVRSLIADLGDAYCRELRRTAIGRFDVIDADPEQVIPVEEALDFLPELRLDADSARRASHGGSVPGRAPGTVRLTDAEGLIALGEPAPGEPLIRPAVVLRPAG